MLTPPPHWARDVESTSPPLIQRRNNVVCPVGHWLAIIHLLLYYRTRLVICATTPRIAPCELKGCTYQVVATTFQSSGNEYNRGIQVDSRHATLAFWFKKIPYAKDSLVQN